MSWTGIHNQSLNRYQLIWRVWWSLTLVFLLSGCIDEIDLEGTGGGAGKMVIQGQLAKNCPSTIRVRVSRTANFAIRSFPAAVENAVVFLEDEVGNQLRVPQVEPGIYQMVIESDNPTISIETGSNYFISVTTSEGSHYNSSLERIKPVPVADSVSIDMIEREELDLNNQRVSKQYLRFFLHTPLESNGSNERARLRWSFESVYRVDE